MVAHNLAKVGVASSNLVIRSQRLLVSVLVEWPRGEATACKAVYTGSNPVSTSFSSAEHERGGGTGRETGPGDWRSGSALP